MSYNPNSNVAPTCEEIQEYIAKEYYLDYRAIENTRFSSIADRLMALKAAKDSIDLTKGILESEKKDEALSSAYPDNIKEARNLCWQFARTMLWNSFNGIRNMILRAQYIEKISSMSKDKIKNLDTINTQNLDELKIFSETASNERNAALEISRARISPTSASFSRMIKERGLTYNKLVDIYRVRFYPNQTTQNLTDNELSRIYSEIIRASGRSNTIINAVSKLSGSVGVLLLGFMLAATVWDIVESAHPIKELIKDVFVITLASVGAFTGEKLGVAVGSAIGVFFAGEETAGTAGLGFIVGILGGIALAFVSALGVESLFKLIFKALTLNIPPELMKSTFTPIYVPLDSPLYERLSMKMS